MSDQNQTLLDDIAFLRGLAEAGRSRPMAGGSILLATGLIFGVASLMVWVGATILAMKPSGYGLIWLGALAVDIVALAVLLRRVPRPAADGQATAGMAWSYLGWSIFVMGASVTIAGYRLGMPNLMLVFPSVLMALYGAGWLIAAFVTRQAWLKLVGYGSFAMSLVNAWFADGPAIWLIYGVSLLLLLALPGFIVMRQSRKAA